MSIIDELQSLLSNIDVKEIEKKIDSSNSIQSQANYNDPKFIEAVREYNKYSELLYSIKEAAKKISQYNDSQVLLNDPGLKDVAAEEMSKLENELNTLHDKIVELTRRPLSDDDKKAIIEVRPGVGGVEAALFADNLFSMYQKYCSIKHYKVEIFSLEYNPEGGINEAIFLVDEPGSYGIFRFESGVHRVQRVPSTESAGRIHTSTASVVVMPEVPNNTIQINPNDLRIDVYRSSGPGGQSVNTTDSAVRITHLPSKLTVTSQNSKSQHKNKEFAMTILISRLNEIEKAQRAESEKELRSESIKGGDRSAKIRTYNFPQGRITDHRAAVSFFNINEIMSGEIDELLSTISSTIRQEKENK